MSGEHVIYIIKYIINVSNRNSLLTCDRIHYYRVFNFDRNINILNSNT